MPISFPPFPDDNDVHTSAGRSWTYDAATGSWIGGLSMAVGTLAAQNANAVAITGGTITGISNASINGNFTVDGSFNAAGNATIGGTLGVTGQVELSASQSATNPTSAMTRALADAWELRNMNRVINLNNAPAATLNGGVTCLNSFDGDYMRVETGSTTPRPVIARARTITVNPGTGLTNQVMPVQIAMLAFMGVSNNGLTRARFWHGGASSSTPPYGDQQPITGRGFGWEAYYNLANGRYEMAVFAHNGASYVYSDGLSGRPEPLVIPSLGSYTPHYFIIGLDAAGNVSLWVSTSMSPPGMTPSLVLAGGPTSGSYGTFGGVCWALAGPSSGTAGGISDMRIIDRKMLLNP